MKYKSIVLVLMVWLVSCKSQKDIVYMQNIENIAIETYSKNSRSYIQPNDQLLIYVSASDMSVAAPFNQNIYKDPNNARVSYSQPSNNAPMASQVSTSGVYYTVYPEGYIDFPVIGEVVTNGKTIEDLKTELTLKLKKYIHHPTVSVRYGNYRISVLGEVNNPGEFILPDGKATLFSALALAGDLTIYGRRDNVLIIREQDGVMTKSYINLKDADFINSPYFHIKQNDVIYVTPNDTRKQSAAFGPQISVLTSLASVVLGIVAGLIFR